MRTRALAAAVVLAASLTGLTACGDSGGTTVTTKDAKVKVDKDKVTVQTSEGTATIGQGLPDGFPKGDIPLLDEKVVNGVKGADGGPFAWSVVMTSARPIDDLSKQVTQAFGAAGYTAARANELGDVSIHQFTNATYDVGVTIARTGDGVTITYLVKNKS
ncbi:hypothetical protein EFL26_19290 [Nocardioides pocheonensis]|jgi:hypothetical protein|uniref:Lipoprotein n=2 Tax=Nocardioides pocheonensis TaxID=661485 RepID=A0A3N0GJV1_9ACTN|nr:hypothetical protein EFL26_19290 [Nocardioides pocheonensis]